MAYQERDKISEVCFRNQTISRFSNLARPNCGRRQISEIILLSKYTKNESLQNSIGKIQPVKTASVLYNDVTFRLCF